MYYENSLDVQITSDKNTIRGNFLSEQIENYNLLSQLSEMETDNEQDTDIPQYISDLKDKIACLEKCLHELFKHRYLPIATTQCRDIGEKFHIWLANFNMLFNLAEYTGLGQNNDWLIIEFIFKLKTTGINF
jgi:hypothetical protein